MEPIGQKNIEAVTFDLWNTIFVAKSYAEKRIEYLKKILDRKRINRSFEEISDAYRFSLESAEKTREQGDYRFITVYQRLDFILEKLDVEINFEEKAKIKKYFGEIILKDEPSLVDGVLETLKALNPYYRMGIICGSGLTPGKVIRLVLKKKNIFDYFQSQVFSDEVGYEKPHPAIFEKSLNELGVKPEQAIHIGDLLDTDIAGAKAFGMKAVWFNYDNKVNETSYQPDFEIRRISGVIKILLPKS
ncbi:MAG: HAD family hydrolase [candidate division WOR-3 bacterium]|nr:HAD family hydrolase [candidate division WOR-3 bacterium]